MGPGKNYLAILIEGILREQDVLDAIPTGALKSLRDRLAFALQMRESIKVRDPLSIPVRQIGFSERTSNVLRCDDITTVGELVAFGREKLLEAPMCGLKTIAEIEKTLSSLGVLPADW